MAAAVRTVSGLVTRREAEAAAFAAIDPFGGDVEAAYRAGAVTIQDLYFLVPPADRTNDFWLNPNSYQPAPYWTESEVAHYWHYLWRQAHSGAAETWRAAVIEQGMADNPGIPIATIQASEAKAGDPCAWGDTWDECVSEAANIALETGIFLTSFVSGCAALAPGGAVAGTFAAPYLPGVSAGVGSVAGCLVGGFTFAGVPGADYDGLGPATP